MNEEEWVAWMEENDPYSVEEEDVLDEVELRRLAEQAEHPERADPVFLLVHERRRGRGGA